MPLESFLCACSISSTGADKLDLLAYSIIGGHKLFDLRLMKSCPFSVGPPILIHGWMIKSSLNKNRLASGSVAIWAIELPLGGGWADKDISDRLGIRLFRRHFVVAVTARVHHTQLFWTGWGSLGRVDTLLLWAGHITQSNPILIMYDLVDSSHFFLLCIRPDMVTSVTTKINSNGVKRQYLGPSQLGLFWRPTKFIPRLLLTERSKKINNT